LHHIEISTNFNEKNPIDTKLKNSKASQDGHIFIAIAYNVMQKGGKKGRTLVYIKLPMLIGHLRECRFQ
jgi:hypothetical protein